MALDDQHQPRPGMPDLLPEVATLDPASTVAGALELLPRPDQDPFQRLALAFLAEYPANTARAYRTDLQAWASWTLTVAGGHPLEARRHHVAAWVRQLTREPTSRTGKPLAATSVARRPACLSTFYGYGLEVGVLTHSPVPHVRRLKASEESASVGLSRDDLGRVLDTSAAHSPRVSALVPPTGLQRPADRQSPQRRRRRPGPRPRASGPADHAEGGKVGRAAIAPVTSRTLDTYLADRTTGPIFLNHDGTARLSYSSAYNSSAASPKPPVSPALRPSTHTASATPSPPKPSTPAPPSKTSKTPSGTPTPAPPAATTAPATALDKDPI